MKSLLCVSARTLIATGFLGAVSSLSAQEWVPPARMKVEAYTPELPIARGAAPDLASSDTNPIRGVAGYSYDSAPRKPQLPTPNLPMPQVAKTATPLPKQESKGLVRGAWGDFKEFVNGKPKAPVPVSQAPTMPRYVEPAAAMPSQPMGSSGIYANAPAYRWYGWGTTTPGANPNAPTGNHPRGSAQWYSQTGATPGAFPTPMIGAYRTLTSAEPPVYVGGPTPNIVEMAVAPIGKSLTLPVTKSEMVAAPPRLESVRQETVPVAAEPRAIFVPTSEPAKVDSPRIEAPKNETPLPAVTPKEPTVEVPEWTPSVPQREENPGFKPAAGTTRPPAPRKEEFRPTPPDWGSPDSAVIQASATAPRPTKVETAVKPVTAVRLQVHEIERLVKNASYGWATLSEMKFHAGNKIHITLNAKTEPEARAAAEEISRLPQLKAYAVTFDARLTK